jgi:hypothetical protein
LIDFFLGVENGKEDLENGVDSLFSEAGVELEISLMYFLFEGGVEKDPTVKTILSSLNDSLRDSRHPAVVKCWRRYLQVSVFPEPDSPPIKIENLMEVSLAGDTLTIKEGEEPNVFSSLSTIFEYIL